MSFGVIVRALDDLGLGEVRGLDFLDGFKEFKIFFPRISGVLGNNCECGREDLGNLCAIIFLMISSCSILSELFSDIL